MSNNQTARHSRDGGNDAVFGRGIIWDNANQANRQIDKPMHFRRNDSTLTMSHRAVTNFHNQTEGSA